MGKGSAWIFILCGGQIISALFLVWPLTPCASAMLDLSYSLHTARFLSVLHVIICLPLAHRFVMYYSTWQANPPSLPPLEVSRPFVSFWKFILILGLSLPILDLSQNYFQSTDQSGWWLIHFEFYVKNLNLTSDLKNFSFFGLFKVTLKNP